MNVVIMPWHNTALQAVIREKQNSKLKKKGFFFREFPVFQLVE